MLPYTITLEGEVYVLVAEDHVSISPEQEVGLLMAESEICKVGVEKLLSLPLSLPSFLGDGSIQPLSEMIIREGVRGWERQSWRNC